MTIEEVKKALEEIKENANLSDDERAHSLEDDLHQAVLKAIADGAENAPELARLALTTNDIDFCRWCA